MIISDLAYLQVATEAQGIVGGSKEKKDKKPYIKVSRVNVSVIKDVEVSKGSSITVTQSNDNIDD